MSLKTIITIVVLFLIIIISGIVLANMMKEGFSKGYNTKKLEQEIGNLIN